MIHLHKTMTKRELREFVQESKAYTKVFSIVFYSFALIIDILILSWLFDHINNIGFMDTIYLIISMFVFLHMLSRVIFLAVSIHEIIKKEKK